MTFGPTPSVPSLGFPGEITENLSEIAEYLKIGNGSPEGRVAGPVGALYLRRDGAGSSAWYVKQSGFAETGWETAMFGNEIDAANVDTGEQVAVDGPVDLATMGPSVTVNIGSSGRAIVFGSAQITLTDFGRGDVYYQIDGTGSDFLFNSIQPNFGSALQGFVSSFKVHTGLTEGSHTFKLMYGCDAANNHPFFYYRRIVVIPI